MINRMVTYQHCIVLHSLSCSVRRERPQCFFFFKVCSMLCTQSAAVLTQPAFQRWGCPEPTSQLPGHDLCSGWLQGPGTQEFHKVSRSWLDKQTWKSHKSHIVSPYKLSCHYSLTGDKWYPLLTVCVQLYNLYCVRRETLVAQGRQHPKVK